MIKQWYIYVIKHWLKMNFHDHSWFKSLKSTILLATLLAIWLAKKPKPTLAKGSFTWKSAYCACNAWGSRSHWSKKYEEKIDIFWLQRKILRKSWKKWIIMNYLYLVATKLCIEYNLKMELRIVKCHNILELMLKKTSPLKSLKHKNGFVSKS